SSLRIYDQLSLSGKIIVARDKAHQQLVALISEGKDIPISLENQTIYYMGPARKEDGAVIGSCGPTTSARMDPFTPILMDNGLKVTIGKGPRSKQVIEAIKTHTGLYLVAFGGCGALYAECVKSTRLIAFEELGPEAMIEITVEDFPVIVGIDSIGNSTFL
ncbi:MAG: TRZ/ATZ family protein, partial [Spirochaetia bacterium]|nr:TRZ/ATZ family protein [Spirochaetia bacterium]